MKDPDLGYGWQIDLKVRNKVERVEEDDEEDAKVPAKAKAKAKAKKRLKMKVPKKQKRSGQKKAFFLAIVILLQLIFSACLVFKKGHTFDVRLWNWNVKCR